MSGNRLRIALFSTLFPNPAQPAHGVFVAERLRHLVASGAVDVRVVAPVPWFPFTGERFGSYARFARSPRSEAYAGLQVLHPRYPVVPRIGMTVAPALLAMAALPALRRLLRDGFDFDLIDAHYYYPDGVAAALLGGRLGKPVVITARGTDINLIPRYALPRRMILWAARRAAASVTVCRALKDEMVRLGAAAERITVLRNGVDLQTFRPRDAAPIRQRLDWHGRVLLSVGHLIERKGHHLTIQALAHLPDDVRLAIVGDGPLRDTLARQVAEAGLTERVMFLGEKRHAELAELYAAADALVLASSREGMANVLLEALASGTPVVATPAWGTPEVVCHADAGVLAANDSPQAIAAACGQLLAEPPARAATRRYAEAFSWEATTAGQLAVFHRVLAAGPRPAEDSAAGEPASHWREGR